MNQKFFLESISGLFSSEFIEQLEEYNPRLDLRNLGVTSDTILICPCPKAVEHKPFERMAKLLYTAPQVCLVCSGKIVDHHFNSLAAKASRAAQELMKPLVAKETYYKSSKKAWFKCLDCGHEEETYINRRAAGQKCEACSHRAVKPDGSNSIAANPKLATYFSHIANAKGPDDIPSGSSKEVFWRCEKLHYFPRAPRLFLRENSRCPTCSKGPLLRETHPWIQEWWSQDNVCNFREARLNTAEAIFKCSERRHRAFRRRLNSFIENPSCPQCNRAEPSDEYNLSTEKKILAEFYRGAPPICNVMPASNKLFDFECFYCSNVEPAKPCALQNSVFVCSNCRPIRTGTLDEILIHSICENIVENEANYEVKLHEKIENFVFDVAVIRNSSVVLAIEFDSEFFHKGKASMKRDKEKSAHFLNNTDGLLLRVRAGNLKPLNIHNDKYFELTSEIQLSDEDLRSIVNFLFRTLDARHETPPTEQLIETVRHIATKSWLTMKDEYHNSVASTEYVEFYIESLNDNVPATQIRSTSHTKLVWRCVNGFAHNFVASANNLISKMKGCPVCYGSQPPPGGYIHSELAVASWPYADFLLSFIPAKNTTKKWFTCSFCGLPFSSNLLNLNRGAGCKHCNTGKKSSDQFIQNYAPHIALAIDFAKLVPKFSAGISIRSQLQIEMRCILCGQTHLKQVRSQTQNPDSFCCYRKTTKTKLTPCADFIGWFLRYKNLTFINIVHYVKDNFILDR